MGIRIFNQANYIGTAKQREKFGCVDYLDGPTRSDGTGIKPMRTGCRCRGCDQPNPHNRGTTVQIAAE